MSNSSESKNNHEHDSHEGAPEAKKAFHGAVEDSAPHKLSRPWIHQSKYSRNPFGAEEVSYIECPETYDGKRPIVFMAGGISGCMDWQTHMKELIHKQCPGLVPLNPRRANFDVTQSNVHHEQIKWEFGALRKSSVIIFWFPKETLCPITLFELGTWSVLHKTHGSDIIVGTDPEYARAADVKTQLSLLTETDFPVSQSLEELANALQQWWDDHSQ